MPREDYYERQAQKLERCQALAESKKEEGSALIDRAHQMADQIPFGQPILVGHHSEKRDRNYRDRIQTTWEKGFETLKTAEHYERRADAIESNRTISGDAPDAIELLKKKLQNLKASHALMIAGNKIIRDKKLTNDRKIEELIKIGLEESVACAKMKGDIMGDFGFPRYAITNSGANIKNVEKRIEQLEKAKSDVTTETVIGNITITNSVEDNRIMIVFPGIPDESIRARLKSDGFRWSPSSGAWQAYRTAAWKIPYIIKYLTVMPAYVNPDMYLCEATP
jgi:hypothetical protein